MKNKYQNENPVQVLQGIFLAVTLIGIMHYFLSYKWLYSILKVYNIETLPLMSWNDLRFTFGATNTNVILPALFGFLWIFMIRLFISNRAYFSFNKRFKKEVRDFRKDWKKIVKEFKSKRLLSKILFISILIIALSVFLYFIIPQDKEITLSFFMYVLFLFFVFPFLYLIITQKRNIILVFHIFFIFAWANDTQNNVIEEISSTNNSIFPQIEFEYKGEIIKSDSTLIHVFSGYENTVMYNVKDSIPEIYSKKDIGRVKYRLNIRK
jgi:hypothetical protein